MIGALTGSLRVLLVAVAFGVGGVIGLREDRSWHELKETRVVELSIAAFEPPEAPDTRERDDEAGRATVDDSEGNGRDDSTARTVDDRDESGLQADNRDGKGGRQ